MERLEHDIPDPKKISIQKVKKNNGVELDGLIILENGCNISPTLYLDYYFENYEAGESFSQVYSELLGDYCAHKPEENIDPSFFTELANIRDRIAMKLIHYESNQELLADVPYIRYLDLAIVFYALVKMDLKRGSASILIHNPHIRKWGIDAEELFEIARENTRRLLPEKLYDMNSMIDELAGRCEADTTITCPPVYPMFVLTNENNLFGAACLLYTDLLKEYAERSQTDFYILPSSIHEVILIPALETDQYDELSAMVREVNDAELADDEILSTHAYYYSRSRNEIIMQQGA